MILRLDDVLLCGYTILISLISYIWKLGLFCLIFLFL